VSFKHQTIGSQEYVSSVSCLKLHLAIITVGAFSSTF